MAPHTVNGEKTFRVGATFISPADEHYYGLGQNQEGILDYRGRSIDCKHFYDAPAGETVCVPFMVTNKGYGIVWDNPSAPSVTPGLTATRVWQSNVGERVSYFVITGATLDELYAGYRKLTGITPLPPKAAFGYIQSKARYETQQQVLDVADGYRSRGYPLDVMVLDWFYWTRMGQLDIDAAAFPGSAGHEPETARARGAHHHQRLAAFREGIALLRFPGGEGLAAEGQGRQAGGRAGRAQRPCRRVDRQHQSRPRASGIWERIRDNIASQGFDWFWLDETEPDLVPDGYFYSIGSGDRYHNLFPAAAHAGRRGRLASRPAQQTKSDPRAGRLPRARSATAACSGPRISIPTWEALKRQIPTGLNFTASGLAYWGNDIGGWQWLPQSHTPERPPLLDPSDARDVVGHNDDYPELITRWYEYATFTPTMRAHGSRKGTEVWSYGKQAEGGDQPSTCACATA